MAEELIVGGIFYNPVMMRKQAFTATLIFLLFNFFNVSAQKPVQDTITLHINQAEELFLKSNFQLLAAKCGIDAADAQILQAKLYPNPNFSISQGVYNPATTKYFETNQNGEESAQLQQLILLAGKRIKNIHLQDINKQITKDLFENLIRTLQLQMNDSFSHLFFLLGDKLVLANETGQLRNVIQAETTLNQKGYASDAEVVRLKAQLVSLQSDIYNLQKSINDEQNNLGILLATGDSLFIKPVLNVSKAMTIKTDTMNFARIMNAALISRPDLKALGDSELYQQQNIKLQKSLAVPDITLGASYDRRGSYVTNFNALSLSFDVPIFNRNQGNIKQAGAFLRQSQYQYQSGEMQVKNDISEAYKNLILSSSQLNDVSDETKAEYDKVISAASDNFLKKNIGLLEYLDYLTSYKDFSQNVHQLQFNFLHNINQLNFSVGKTVLNYD